MMLKNIFLYAGLSLILKNSIEKYNKILNLLWLDIEILCIF